MQDFAAMVYFVHVVEQGGFTAAARHLSEPLSTISRRIGELEQSLGARLLERSTRRVRLTSLGETYYEYCRRGLQEFESAGLALENRQSEVSGLLRITVPPSLAAPFFVPLATHFQALYPNARVAILSTERHVDLLHERIDLAFRVGPLRDSQLYARKIASYRSHLVAAPSYLADRPAIRQPADLPAHRIVAFDSREGAVAWELRREGADGETAAVDLLPHLIMNDFAGIVAATLLGSGIARIPSILCAPHVRAGGLLRVLPGWVLEDATISAVMAGNRNLSRLIRLFLDHCAGELPRLLADAEFLPDREA